MPGQPEGSGQQPVCSGSWGPGVQACGVTVGGGPASGTGWESSVCRGPQTPEVPGCRSCLGNPARPQAVGPAPSHMGSSPGLTTVVRGGFGQERFLGLLWPLPGECVISVETQSAQ